SGPAANGRRSGPSAHARPVRRNSRTGRSDRICDTPSSDLYYVESRGNESITAGPRSSYSRQGSLCLCAQRSRPTIEGSMASVRRTERKQTTIPRFSRVVANREFRGLWLAQALSIAGDQLAKVALAILVYQRTASPLWSAVVYAMPFLPAPFGGQGWSQLAARFPRRTLLIWCILAQAALVGIMAVPGMPLPVLCALVFFVAMLSAPTNAAQNATAREAFDDDAEYLRSQDLRGITTNTMMLLGLAGGGLLVTAVGVPWALAIDAATFVLAAVIIHLTVRWRPAAGSPEDGWSAGARITASDPHLRVLFAMALLVGLTVVPEGLAAPIAAQMDEPDVAVGWLLAADPLGFVIGAFVFSHYASPATRLRL